MALVRPRAYIVYQAINTVNGKAFFSYCKKKEFSTIADRMVFIAAGNKLQELREDVDRGHKFTFEQIHPEPVGLHGARALVHYYWSKTEHLTYQKDLKPSKSIRFQRTSTVPTDLREVSLLRKKSSEHKTQYLTCPENELKHAIAANIRLLYPSLKFVLEYPVGDEGKRIDLYFPRLQLGVELKPRWGCHERFKAKQQMDYYQERLPGHTLLCVAVAGTLRGKESELTEPAISYRAFFDYLRELSHKTELAHYFFG